MKTIVYLSTPTVPFSDEDLTDLLVKSRDNNMKRNVSGMLLFLNDLFIQVLEGEDDEVDDLYNHIARDSRHHKLTKIYDQPIEERLFDVWAMAFDKMSSEELMEAGYFTLEEFKEITEGVMDYESIKILRSILDKNQKV